MEEAGGADAKHDERWAEYVSKHRCDSASRGSVYDSRAGTVTRKVLPGRPGKAHTFTHSLPVCC